MTEPGSHRRNRILLVGGTSALVVIAALAGWLVLADQSEETIAATGRQPTATSITIPITTTTKPPAESWTISSSGGAASVDTGDDKQEMTRQCAADAVLVTTDTDRDVYSPGASVVIRSTARNLSSETCFIGGPTNEVFTDSGGNTVLELTIADQIIGDGRLSPGESLSWTNDWVPRGCVGDAPCGGEPEEVPPGQYSVTVIWGSVAQGSAAFEIHG